MDKRKIAAVSLLGVGALLTGLAVYATDYISHVESNFDKFTSFFSASEFSGIIHGEFNRKISTYDKLIKISFWSGLSMTIAGIIWLIVLHFKKKETN